MTRLHKRASEGKVILLDSRKQAGAGPLLSPLIPAGDWGTIDWKTSGRIKALSLAGELNGSPQGLGLLGELWLLMMMLMSM